VSGYKLHVYDAIDSDEDTKDQSNEYRDRKLDIDSVVLYRLRNRKNVGADLQHLAFRK